MIVELGAVAVAVSAGLWWRGKQARNRSQASASRQPKAKPLVTNIMGGQQAPPIEPDDSSWLGRNVGGYKLVEVLGEGGMATVYKATHQNSPAPYFAVKLIRREFAQDDVFRRRFEREVQVSKNLKHPNIIELIDSGQEDGVLYLVLEFIDGDVLTKNLPPDGLPVPQAVAYISSLIDGLDYAHALGVVHRDLKPDNVMIDQAGQVKITDFGLARSEDVEKVTKTGDSLGTPAYFPPEQITGAKPSAAADQYSLGIMLYEMLAGVRPFSNPKPMELLMQHLSEKPASLLEHKPGLHPTLSAIALRMLEKRPEDRFKTLLMVKEGLQAIAAGRAWEMPERSEPAMAPQASPQVASIAPQRASEDMDDDSTCGFQVSTEPK